MKKPSVTVRGVIVALLTIPYLFVVLGVLSSYIAFYHRLSFQAQVEATQKEEMKTLVLSATEYKKVKWTEQGKEFEFDGKMYDVANVERQGTNYVITCENDSLEDLFINWMQSAGKTKSKLIPQIQFFPPIAELEINALIGSQHELAIAPDNFYSSFPTEIIPPPPRVF